MLKKSLISTCLLAFLFTIPLTAQQIGSIDFRNLNVSEMSDAEIRQISREIESRGLTLREFEQLAISQGAQRSRVQQLVQRIRASRADVDLDRDEEEDRRIVRRDDTIEDEMFIGLEEEEVPDSLRIFGSDLFEMVARSFEPSFNVPTPRNYTLGAGDEVVIDIWGAAEQTYMLTVSAEGNIRVPNLSPIYVNGLSIEDASDRIMNRLGEIYSGLNPTNPEQGNTFAQVVLGNVRSIKVTVMGEAKQPGTYSVSSLSTVFNALYAAGGPNRSGSFREIHIIRDNEVIEIFDIYDILVYGNQESNIRLRDQDIIKIKPYHNRIHVWGETKRVGFFESIDGETIEDLVEFMAGFSENAYTRKLTLHRVTPAMQSVKDIFYPEQADTELRNGDKLRVGEILDRYENRVMIQGSVFRPGEYEFEPGMTLYDLIQKADGVKEEAFLTRGIIYRLKANMEADMVNFSVENVLNDPVNYDIPLHRDDNVRISSAFDMREELTLRISGAVNRPTTLEFRDNMTLEDAIFRASGFRDRAASYRVEVARRVIETGEQRKVDRIAEVYSFDVDENLGFREDEGDFILQPFDRIYVRTKPNYQEQQTVTITGEVQYPGEYVLHNRNARLSDLVEMAGGLSDYAFPRGASLQRIYEITETEVPIERRENGGEINPVDQLLNNRTRTEVDTVMTAVGIRLFDALSDNSSAANLILEEGDELHIPKELQTVRVEGEVLSPTSVRYDPRRSFSDYISAAGGVTEEAKRRRAYVIYANGEVDRTRSFLRIRSNPDVEPGATIVIPRERDRREMTPQERISLASSIASTALLLITILERIDRI